MLLKVSEHRSQVNKIATTEVLTSGFFSGLEWIFWCLIRIAFWRKDRPHMSQMKGLTPLWVFKWWLRAVFPLNFLSQELHWYFLSVLCLSMCCLKLFLDLKPLEHISHLKKNENYYCNDDNSKLYKVLIYIVWLSISGKVQDTMFMGDSKHWQSWIYYMLIWSVQYNIIQLNLNKKRLFS